MDNLLRLIRQRNIFGAGNPDSEATPWNNIRFGSVVNDQPDSSDDNYDVGRRMHELYQPAHEMSDRYRAILDAMPQRENPSLFRKLGALATSFAGNPQLTEHALYAPYERNMADWQTRLKTIEPAARDENADNANMRAIANSIISQEQGSRRLERQYSRDRVLEQQGNERIAQGDARIKQGDTRLEQAQARIDIAREMAKGGSFQVDNAGNAFIVRKDGSTIPVKGEYLSFEEKEALKTQNAVNLKAAPGSGSGAIKTDIIDDPEHPGQKVLVQIHPDSTYTIIRGKGGEAATPKPRTEVTEATTELGKSREAANRANNFRAMNSKLGKYVSFDKQGRPQIQKPGYFTGPSQDDYEKIYNYIFGGQQQEQPAKRPLTGRPVDNSKLPPGPGGLGVKPPPAGRVRVVGPNGETGTVSLEESKNLPTGWKVKQ